MELEKIAESLYSQQPEAAAKLDKELDRFAALLEEVGNAVLIRMEKARYRKEKDPEQIKEYRGTLTEPGKESPYRNRSVEENLQLFEEMKEGKYADGEKVLRAKIDMAAANINMRDPIIYRVAHMTHHNTGDQW